MSMSINLELEDLIDIEDAFAILDAAMKWQQISRDPNRISGVIPGSQVNLLKLNERRRALSEEIYGNNPNILASFDADKITPYETSYRSIFTSIVGLLQATNKNALATSNGRIFLRRIDGYTTLYNDTGLFDADVQPQWRPMFSFADDFKERFER